LLEPIKKIVIAGGGTAGWMTAAALSNTLKNTCDIILVESEEIGSIGVGEATIPQMAIFNGSLGINEDEMLRKTQGTIKLGIEFVDWSHIGSRYMHPFGVTGFKSAMLPFHHYWLKQRSLCAAKNINLPPIDEYSLNTVAAREGKFIRPGPRDKGPLGDMSHAFHFDASLYAMFLREYAEKRGVIRREGKILKAQVRESDGFIHSLVMENGDVVEGELFIDCTGFRALLIEQTLKVAYIDYSAMLPCDRAYAVPSENIEDPKPFTRSTALSAGWQWRIPLQHRTGNGYVFSSKYLSDDEAAASLLANIEGKPLAEPRLIKFTTGRRKVFWEKNCVAIGLSSGFLEPLESTSIHLIQTAIAKLINLFPDRSFRELERKQFNEKSALEFERIRDFIILHYKATRREDSEFWNTCRNMEIPQYLEKKIKLYKNSGRIFRDNEELFSEAGWFAVMNGQEIYPESWHPFVDMMEDESLQASMEKVRAAVKKISADMPTQKEFILKHFSAKP